jgi:hypothetical protein
MRRPINGARHSAAPLAALAALSILAALNLYNPDVISPPLVNRQPNPFCGLFQIAEATPFLHAIEQCLLWVRCWPSALIDVPSVNAKPAHYSPRMLPSVIGGRRGSRVSFNDFVG